MPTPSLPQSRGHQTNGDRFGYSVFCSGRHQLERIKQNVPLASFVLIDQIEPRLRAQVPYIRGVGAEDSRRR